MYIGAIKYLHHANAKSGNRISDNLVTASNEIIMNGALFLVILDLDLVLPYLLGLKVQARKYSWIDGTILESI